MNLGLVTVVRPTAPAAPIDSMRARVLDGCHRWKLMHTNISASIAAHGWTMETESPRSHSLERLFDSSTSEEHLYFRGDQCRTLVGLTIACSFFEIGRHAAHCSSGAVHF
jgi:hypothetical protein